MIPKFPFFLTLILGGFSAWLWLNDHVMRALSVMVLLPLWLLLMGLWWALRLKGKRLSRLAVVIVWLDAARAASIASTPVAISLQYRISAAWAPMAYSERQAAIVMFFMAVSPGVKGFVMTKAIDVPVL